MSVFIRISSFPLHRISVEKTLEVSPEVVYVENNCQSAPSSATGSNITGGDSTALTPATTAGSSTTASDGDEKSDDEDDEEEDGHTLMEDGEGKIWSSGN